MKCPLCNRPLVDGPSVDRHHLIPKMFRGSETIRLHTVCHQKIHHTFTERELNACYNTVDKLISHPEIVKFVKWVAKKDPEFHTKNKDTNRRRNKRKYHR